MMTAITRVTPVQFSFFPSPGVFFLGETTVLWFLLHCEEFCWDRQRFCPFSSSLALVAKKNKVHDQTAAAKYSSSRPTGTSIHHDLELSYSPHTGEFREHECRTVVGPISARGSQRRKPRKKNTRRLRTDHEQKRRKQQKKHEKNDKNNKTPTKTPTKKTQKDTKITKNTTKKNDNENTSTHTRQEYIQIRMPSPSCPQYPSTTIYSSAF